MEWIKITYRNQTNKWMKKMKDEVQNYGYKEGQ